MKQVPNKVPVTNNPSRIAVVGEFPATEEVRLGEPFVGASGHLLKNLLANTGININDVFFGNVCQYQPPGNNLKLLSSNSPELIESKHRLREDLEQWKPNIIILLGGEVLRMAGETDLTLTAMRGTIFQCREVGSPFFGFKCISTYHAAACMRMPSWIPILRLDLHKAYQQSQTPHVPEDRDVIDVHLSVADTCDKLYAIPDNSIIALDIEGDVNNVTCLSIATSANYAFSIELSTLSLEDEMQTIKALRHVLGNTKIGKVLQNALYDNFALTYRYGILIRNVMWDTMLSGWEIYPELPKNLGMQASIWTNRPAYKHERKINDWTKHLQYCCKDSLTTYEIMLAHKRYFEQNKGAYEHFKFNMSLLPIYLYMQVKGIRYDSDNAKLFLSRTLIRQEQIQDRINRRAKEHINVNSPKQLCKILYNHPKNGGLGFPKQHPKVGNRKDVSRLTSDVNAILHLQKSYDDTFLSDVLGWRSLDKYRTMLQIQTDEDKRIRCAYNAVGTDTGRLACHKSPTGSGANLQTVTEKLRCLYLADPGHYAFQCDLEGADGWTVAARCATLGDRTMLDDYLAGIKPARVIALMQKYGAEVNSWSREAILEKGKSIGDGDTAWLYFTCKRVQHGTNYELGPQTMSNVILKDSYKLLGRPITVSMTQCKELQRLYLLRYGGIPHWKNWVRQQLLNYGKLESASGHTRRFFGNPKDNMIFRAALSQEPQHNTTYVTNAAIKRLWEDPKNRRSDGSLIIQPFHQVHDAMCGQFPTHLVDFTKERIKHYFDIPITIGNITVTIPTDGCYGTSWGDAKPSAPGFKGFLV